MSLKVPDPEDKKYWVKLHVYDPLGQRRSYFVFLEDKYIRDFREWKDKMNERFGLCTKCANKKKCDEVRAYEKDVCPDLIAPFEVLEELFGEEASRENLRNALKKADILNFLG